MPKTFTPLIDLPVALVFYGLALHFFLDWVRQTDNENVEKTPRTTKRICIRLAELTVLVLLLCYATNAPFWAVLLISLGLIFLPTSGDAIGVIGLPFLAIGYAIALYILGFPGVVLNPPEHAKEAEDEQDRLTTFIGRTANTSGSLRPQGDIEIDGIRFPAKSESGQMISEGLQVTITGVQNGKLLVRELQNAA